MNLLRLAQPLLEAAGPVTSFTQLEELTDSLISQFNNWGKYAKTGLSSCEDLALSDTVELSTVDEAPLMLDIPDHCYKRIKGGRDGEGFLLAEEEINLLAEDEQSAMDTVEIGSEKVELDLDTYGEYLKGLLQV